MIIKEIETKSVLTKSNLPVSDYSVNPYVGCTHACKYCYASFMKRFTNHPEPWGEFLDVKYWQDIKNPQKYCGKELFFGSVTDPYNPQEETYKRTRTLLEQLQGSGVKLSIQTKSDLVLRDMDLIKTFPDARVGFSINTLDEEFKDDMDKAVSIERRLSAMKKLHDAGIRTTCFISPIFPGITDVPAIIDRVKDQCNLVWLENLNLRGSYKTVIMDYIREKHPDLLPLYEEIYAHGSRLYWEGLDGTIRTYAKDNGFEYVRDDDTMNKPFNAPPTIVNFFYHEEIKKSAKKGKNTNA
ncbi:radical SAM mobile pair protein B [Campylobacter fetus subsp. venerealis]|uniref:radical SAM mobile pair protein B n=1 Tax=Campylobacter fetus TaxID=196 RepID=UPI0018E76211|nr:radical SAM mobile pair protein B [Campylobacter fetus]QQF52147.1 radical SAM mobile pair protein B [Campylobacter fetus subsp. venerealis]